MRIESSVTAVSWVPLDCVEGGQRLHFHVGAAQYDEPPPAHLDDVRSLLAAGRVRLANQLRGSIEVSNGRVVAHHQAGQGHIGATGQAARSVLEGTRGTDSGSPGMRAEPPAVVGFAAVALPDLRPEPEVGAGWVRFGQTAGGLLSVGMPYRSAPTASPRLAAPAAWTTLALTVHADGTSEQTLTGASPFPRHWVYDHTGRLVATSGVVDFTAWQADAWDPFTPWGGRDAPVRATAVETALERELSLIIVGSAPHWLRLRRGATLVEQGDPGHELYLLFDGLLAVEIDGQTVAELGPGAVVGEVALLEGGRRTATLRAVTACRVAAVPGDRIDRDALAELARSRGWPGPGGTAEQPNRERWPGPGGATGKPDRERWPGPGGATGKPDRERWPGPGGAALG
ncbi:MAG TPA: cyclic nucleotide-binding domain-containing protein [Actinomycetes bacterium]|nr:cyclic nucleotide-binding domain-containing protein [Actinomycetes bacterium]